MILALVNHALLDAISVIMLTLVLNVIMDLHSTRTNVSSVKMGVWNANLVLLQISNNVWNAKMVGHTIILLRLAIWDVNKASSMTRTLKNVLVVQIHVCHVLAPPNAKLVQKDFIKNKDCVVYAQRTVHHAPITIKQQK